MEDKKTTMSEMLNLLTTLQHFQYEVADKKGFDITTHFDEDGLWLTFSTFFGEKPLNGYCYPFYTIEENVEKIIDFKEDFIKLLEKPKMED